MESAIVAGMGLDTPLHQKSLKTNLENIAGDVSIHHGTKDDTYALSKAIQLQVQGQWTRWMN